MFRTALTLLAPSRKTGGAKLVGQKKARLATTAARKAAEKMTVSPPVKAKRIISFNSNTTTKLPAKAKLESSKQSSSTAKAKKLTGKKLKSSGAPKRPVTAAAATQHLPVVDVAEEEAPNPHTIDEDEHQWYSTWSDKAMERRFLRTTRSNGVGHQPIVVTPGIVPAPATKMPTTDMGLVAGDGYAAPSQGDKKAPLIDPSFAAEVKATPVITFQH